VVYDSGDSPERAPAGLLPRWKGSRVSLSGSVTPPHPRDTIARRPTARAALIIAWLTSREPAYCRSRSMKSLRPAWRKKHYHIQASHCRLVTNGTTLLRTRRRLWGSDHSRCGSVGPWRQTCGIFTDAMVAADDAGAHVELQRAHLDVVRRSSCSSGTQSGNCRLAL